MARGWYVISTYSGYEKKIEKHIRILMEQPTLAPYIFDCKFPVEETTEIKEGKKKIKTSLSYAGYMFLELDLTDLQWKQVCSEIRRIDGVSGFVGQINREKPRPVSAEEMRIILQKTGDMKVDKNSTVRVDFSEGESVKIVDGPFDTFTGKIEEVYADKGKLRVMIGIFGRNTPVEVDYTQVEKI